VASGTRNKRTVIELEVDELGPSLRYASAKVTKNPGATAGDQEAEQLHSV